MPINAMIPLATQVPELGRSVASGAIAGNQLLEASEFRKNAPLRDRMAQAEVTAAESKMSREESMAQLERAAMDLTSVQQSLARGDVPTALSQLNRRRADIIARNGKGADTEDTDRWIGALQSGDPAQMQAFKTEMDDVGALYQQFRADGTQASYGQPVEVIGPDGKPSLVQFDKRGNQLAANGYSPAPKADAGASYGQPVAGVGPDGKPVYMRFDKSGNMIPVQGFQPPPKSGGMSMTTNPDGTVTWNMGGSGPESTNSTNSKIEQSILSNDQAMQHLNEIETGYRPEYLTLQTKWGAGIANLKDKLGQLDPNSQEAKTLNNYATFAAASGDYFAKTLKEMSGGAVTPEEGSRQEKWIPNIDTDGPVQFKSKADRSIRFIKSANARLHYARANGLSAQQMYKMPLESVPSLINSRGAELETAGVPPDQIQAQLQQEFGL